MDGWITIGIVLGLMASSRIYHFHTAREDVYCDLESKAEVGLINGNVGEFRGWYRFLTEHHIPFDSLAMDAAQTLL